MSGRLVESIKMYRLWFWLASKDIKAKYRGSVIGPFWLVLNLGILVAFLSVIYSMVFGLTIKSYVPYITLGFTCWYLLSASLVESSKCLIDNASIVRNFGFPVTVFVFRTITKNLFLLFHNLLVYLIVVLIFQVKITFYTLYFIPGLILNIWILVSLGILLSIPSARFRDIPHIIENFIQMSMFITPVLFYRDMLKNRAFIVDANPFYHMIEVMRAPLLGVPPERTSWEFLFVFAILISLAGYYVLKKQSSKVSYWV